MSQLEGVGVVARLLGVSVRTLHHWHHLGVAVPSSCTSSGYRAYSPADIARLRRVLLFRDLGVPLQRIPALLEAPSAERRKDLEHRRSELAAKILHLQGLSHELDRLLAAEHHGILLPAADQRQIFGQEWDPAWPLEARGRWADSTQWAEYTERSAGRSVQGWQEVASTMQGVTDALAEAKRAGVAPGNEQANLLAERHREAMSEHFYCTHSMHVLVACRYVTEAGFLEYYDRAEPGLAVWLKQVIDDNARSTGVDPDSAVWE